MNTKLSLPNRGRVMVAKVGLDGHDRGAKVLSRILREEGFEVIYVGVRHTPEQVAKFALQEKVDVVGLSLLSGAHVELGGAVRRALDSIGLAHVPITIGGLIPRADAEALNAVGISKCFHPGENCSDPERIAEEMDRLIEQSRQNPPAYLKTPL
jgi:methylmalonyl-CoA mutase C-terminal domain/subunit